LIDPFNEKKQNSETFEAHQYKSFYLKMEMDLPPPLTNLRIDGKKDNF
jgi:hypothetical protein